MPYLPVYHPTRVQEANISHSSHDQLNLVVTDDVLLNIQNQWLHTN